MLVIVVVVMHFYKTTDKEAQMTLTNTQMQQNKKRTPCPTQSSSLRFYKSMCFSTSSNDFSFSNNLVRPHRSLSGRRSSLLTRESGSNPESAKSPLLQPCTVCLGAHYTLTGIATSIMKI